MNTIVFAAKLDGLDRLNLYMLVAGTMTLLLAGGFYAYYLLKQGVLASRTTAQLATSGGGNTSVSLKAEATMQPRHPAGTYANVLHVVAIIFLALAVTFRWIVTGHAPYSNQYEFASALTFSTALIGFILVRQFRQQSLGAFVAPLSALIGLYAIIIPVLMPEQRDVKNLIPALQNGLMLTIHVAMAIAAYGGFVVAGGAAIMYLLQRDKEPKRKWLPSRIVLDDIGYQSVLIGFPLMIAVLVLGGLWAKDAWGAFWSWDPKETAALVTALVYGVYLHAHSLPRWKGSRSAWLLVLGLVATVFTFLGNYFLGGLHTYGVPGK